MGYLCIVKNCNNSSNLTMINCKLFKIPKDERSEDWLINCKRHDLLGRSLEYCRVCSYHFVDKMFADPYKTVLLPTAVPTDFSMIFNGEICITSTKQKLSTSNYPSTSVSADCSVSSSAQTTQILPSHIPWKRNWSKTVEIPDLLVKRSKDTKNDMIGIEEQKRILATRLKNPYEDDDIDVFFKSIAMTVKKMPPQSIKEAKLKTLMLITEIDKK
ncbi:uncharacterized protein LOC112602087 [Melanaphis sacchari]|uniref:Repressor of the inhibitor of the protein kinase n=1 Tax=Melanaphis sacchari TaxID=742174 RepID=A0A2H8TGK0_9HEMI|nr:uncharacterized protein LOC112602087 [Melanaphis sacchari]